MTHKTPEDLSKLDGEGIAHDRYLMEKIEALELTIKDHEDRIKEIEKIKETEKVQ